MKYLKNWQTYKLNEDAIVNDDDSMNGTGVINNGQTNPSATTTPSATSTASTPGNVVQPTTQTTELVLTNDDAKKVKEQLKSNPQAPFLKQGIEKENPQTTPFIKFVQDVLKIGIDGSFGKNTYDAVLKFQTDKNLTGKDGIVGQETWKALLSLVGLKDVKIVVSKDKKPVSKVPQKGTTTPTATKPTATTPTATTPTATGGVSKLTINQKVKASDFITEKVNSNSLLENTFTDLTGIDMNVIKGLITDPKTKQSFIQATFSKDGKKLYYGQKEVVRINIDAKTGGVAKGTKEQLLKNLVYKSSPKFTGDMTKIVDEIVDLLDGYTGVGAIKEIYDLLLPLQDKETKKALLYHDDYEDKDVDAYQYFFDAYKRDESSSFEDDLKGVTTNTFNSNDINTINNLYKLIKQLNPNAKFERK